MVQLRVLSGNKAGTNLVTRRFPVHVGRSSQSGLQLDDDGVWDRHLRIDFVRGKGYIVTAESGALLSVNGQCVESARLRNGDALTLGAVGLQFWLAETSQRRLGFRESFTWVMIAGICLLQVALVYILIRL